MVEVGWVSTPVPTPTTVKNGTGSALISWAVASSISNTWWPTTMTAKIENKDQPLVHGLPDTLKSPVSEWYSWENDLRRELQHQDSMVNRLHPASQSVLIPTSHGMMDTTQSAGVTPTTT